MEKMAFTVTATGSVEDVVDRTTAALKDVGFGVLTRIDVHTAFKEKIDVDFRPYVVLGACNPKLAHRALAVRTEIGLFMPCNVTVEETSPGTCSVGFADPDVVLSPGDLLADKEIRQVSTAARDALQQAASALAKG